MASLDAGATADIPFYSLTKSSFCDCFQSIVDFYEGTEGTEGTGGQGGRAGESAVNISTKQEKKTKHRHLPHRITASTLSAPLAGGLSYEWALNGP